MDRLPGSVLFACDNNAVRSPMAEGMMKLLFGAVVYVDSAGVRKGELDPFAVAVMQELGADISRHKPKTFDDLQDSSFDVIISLSPSAQHSAVEMTRASSCDLLFWQTFDATAARGNRETILGAYREARDLIRQRIEATFGPAPSASNHWETP